MKITAFGRELSLDTPQIMGILNVTPDSFSDGGRYNTTNKALDHAADMVRDGAAIIDIGGESTRPGAAEVSLDEELSRVIPAVEAIAKQLDVMISVDTSQPEVMRKAVEAGAHIINDIRALSVEGALNTVTALACPVILMHMQGQPGTMQIAPHYDDVVQEVKDFLLEKAQLCISGGIKKENLIFDPGFGFGKSVTDNYTLLSHLDELVKTGYPVLSALSRKSMIGAACSIQQADQRIAGSVAGALISVMKGACLVRVHDVAQTREALDVFRATAAAD